MHAAAYYGDVDALRSAVLDALARDAADHSESREYDLREPEDSPLAALDACGNTPLHVAVLRRRRDAVIALLDDDRWDYPVEARSGGGWTALQEATHMGSRWMTRRLFAATLDRSKREFERKRPRLVEAVRNMPDFRAKMHWEFGSAVFGPVLRMYAPSDTYEITKRGAALRVDGTLRGMDDERDELGQPKNRSLLPRWKRGAFSLLLVDADADASGKPPSTRSRLLYVDHDKGEAVDTTDEGEDAEELARGERERVEAEADELLRRGPTKEKYRADDVTFRPAKSWMGNDRAEKVGRWRAEVWDAAGKMTKRRVTRLGEFRVDGSFSEYLESASRGAADAVETTPVEEFHEEIHEEIHEEGEEGEEDEVNDDEVNDDEVNDDEVNDDDDDDKDVKPVFAKTSGVSPSVSGSASRSDAAPARPPTARERRRARRAEKPPKPRKVSARCWIARDFPLRADDLAPILDVMSHANKHLKKVKRLVEYWRGAHGDAFPVKVQVPIVMTAYVTVDFRDFATLDTHDESGDDPIPRDFFDVPKGYETKSLLRALKDAEEEERRLLEAEAAARRDERERRGREAEAKQRRKG